MFQSLQSLIKRCKFFFAFMTSNGTLVLVVNYANSKKCVTVYGIVMLSCINFSHSNSRFLTNLKKYFPLSNFLFCFA